jgi:hypothetical protein
MHFKKSRCFFGFLILIVSLFLSSCSRLGWGILLWATEEPPIPSGTVLPVYIRSNIDKVWVVGIPEAFKTGKGSPGKIEIPLSRLELAGSKGNAQKLAEAFAQYAPFYAENLQDGLPIRDNPDNGARRVYRLRTGEIVKILEKVEGNPAISATGEPLPGDWYKVLTDDGSSGFCFSYRLKLFQHYGGSLLAAPAAREEFVSDPDLDMLLAKRWSPESYAQMINSRRINISELQKYWGFDPGQDTGQARIYLPDLDQSFAYTGIRSDGERAWRFEGTSLQMNLRTNSSLVVQFVENTGGLHTLLFAALPADIDDLIIQEYTRREGLITAIYNQGPVFTSNNYGSIIFSGNGEFSWTGFDLLIPNVVPRGVAGYGRVSMDLFLTPSFEEFYTGACTFHFADGPAREIPVHFMYTLDHQGLRLEVAPEFTIEENTVTRRLASPVVIYFFRDQLPLSSSGSPFLE